MTKIRTHLMRRATGRAACGTRSAYLFADRTLVTCHRCKKFLRRWPNAV